jgi:hypothetical protein
MGLPSQPDSNTSSQQLTRGKGFTPAAAKQTNITNQTADKQIYCSYQKANFTEQDAKK